MRAHLKSMVLSDILYQARGLVAKRRTAGLRGQKSKAESDRSQSTCQNISVDFPPKKKWQSLFWMGEVVIVAVLLKSADRDPLAEARPWTQALTARP